MHFNVKLSFLICLKLYSLYYNDRLVTQQNEHLSQMEWEISSQLQTFSHVRLHFTYIEIICVSKETTPFSCLRSDVSIQHSRKLNFRRSQDGKQGFMMLYKFWKLQSQSSIMEWKNKAALKVTMML